MVSQTADLGPRRPASPSATAEGRPADRALASVQSVKSVDKLVRRMRAVGVLLVLVCSASPAFAQSAVTGAANRKQATATRVPNGSIRVDGRLDDESWRNATPITDFIQKEPTEGAAPTDA